MDKSFILSITPVISLQPSHQSATRLGLVCLSPPKTAAGSKHQPALSTTTTFAVQIKIRCFIFAEISALLRYFLSFSQKYLLLFLVISLGTVSGKQKVFVIPDATIQLFCRPGCWQADYPLQRWGKKN